MNETEELQKNIFAYSPEETDEISSGQKKFAKKYPEAAETLSSFGNNQNEFNRSASDLIEELVRRCTRLEEALAAEIKARKRDTEQAQAVKKELDDLKSRVNRNFKNLEGFKAAMAKYSERTESYILHISPGARLKDCPKGCREAKVDGIINLPEHLKAIKKAIGEDRDSRLAHLERVCMKAVSNELSYFNAYEEIGIDFYGTEKYAEIIYRNLCKNSIYKIEHGHKSGDSGRYFVCCGETAAIPDKTFTKSGMIFITGRAPFDGLSEKYIDDLRFMNDCGIHSYTAMNIEAYNALKEAGFRCISAATAEELASGKVISAVEAGIENAVPGGAERYSSLIKRLENSGIVFAVKPDDILGYVLHRRKSGDCTLRCIRSLEKTASAAIIKNYFGTSAITSSDISQPAGEQFDFVTGFDYINHFGYRDRISLYKKAKSMLKPGGLLLFSGKDPVTEIKIRAVEGWEKYSAYEAMWTSKQLVTELEENGFQVRFLIPTGTGLYSVLPDKYKEIPSLYIIGAVPL